MNKTNYSKSSQISPRTSKEKSIKLRLNKSKLSKLNLKKHLNLNILKKQRANRTNDNSAMRNQSLSNVNSTNILNVFTASFDSNKSLHSNNSFKSIRFIKENNMDNNIELLKNIRIKDNSADDDSFRYKGEDQSNTVSFKKIQPDNTNESKKSKIWISKAMIKLLVDISTIYNKANTSTKYHRKPSLGKQKDEGRNARMMMMNNHSDNDPRTTSYNGYQNDRNETIRLKKKITELLEVNSMLVSSRQELEKENGVLNRTIVQLKKYITDNKIEDMKELQYKLKESNSEIKRCNEIIQTLQQNNKKFEMQALNINNDLGTKTRINTNESNTGNINSNRKTVNSIKTSNKELSTQEKQKIESISHLNKLTFASNITNTASIANRKNASASDNSKLSEINQSQSKIFQNIPKFHFTNCKKREKQQKISSSGNHQSYDLDINDI